MASNPGFCSKARRAEKTKPRQPAADHQVTKRQFRRRREKMMKYVLIFLSLLFLVVFAGISPVSASAPVSQQNSADTTARASGKPTWEMPIAAGVWYPTDASMPEKPMRYYRVRCWPGCHTGSSYGKYPHKALNDRPIFPTSTIDMHSKGPAAKE
jgi:hypothetical protein